MRTLISVLFITLLFAFLCPTSNALKLNSENSTSLTNSTNPQISDDDAETIQGLQITLNEFNSNVDDLIAKFNAHNALYDSWILAAKTEEEKYNLRNNEKKNLDFYITTATQLYAMIKLVKDNLDNYGSDNSGNSGSNSGTNEGTDTLLQIFAKRYEELGLKMDTKASALLQLNGKTRKSFLKK